MYRKYAGIIIPTSMRILIQSSFYVLNVLLPAFCQVACTTCVKG